MIDMLPVGYVHTTITYPVTETLLVYASAGTTSIPRSSFTLQSLLDYVRTRILWNNSWSAYALAKWDEAKEQTKRLGDLHDNWDGYGALPIEKMALSNTLKFLGILANWWPSIPVPEIIPMTNGTISLVWESASLDAALQIGNKRYSAYIRTISQIPALFEGTFDSDTENTPDNLFISSVAEAAQPFTPSFTSTVTPRELINYSPHA